MLIVHNRMPRIVDIPAPHRKRGDEYLPSDPTKHVKLIPGANVVKPEAWAEVEKYPVIQAHIRAGDIAVDQKQASEFAKLGRDEAIALARETKDRRQLREWLSEESRGQVRMVLEEAIEKLTIAKGGK